MIVNLDTLRQLSHKSRNTININQIIESLHDRQDYAKYHFKEFKILSSYNNQSELIISCLSMDTESIDKRLAIKANIMACIQSMHITHDLLAQLIFNVLVLTINGNITLYQIITYLESLRNGKYSKLLELLIKLAGKDVKNKHLYIGYVSAIVNHSKHTYTIEPKTKTYFYPNVHKRFYFKEFNYKGFLYKEIDAEFLINSEYNREAKLIIEIENELINILTEENTTLK